MDQHQPLVSIPSIPFYCNLVVFPSPHKATDVSRFFILSNSPVAPDLSDEKVTFDYIPRSVYCFLPSLDKAAGKITLLSGQPSFVHDFTFPYCLEINPKSLEFSHLEKNDVSKSQAEPMAKRCIKCFKSNFPSPNTLLCKWNKNKKDKVEKPWPVRLRGGAESRVDMIDTAVRSARVHGINIHAGVENLANGNCIFESIIDSINTRASFEEHLDETPDYYRQIWMTEVENVAYEDWNRGMTRSQWSAGWQVLKESGTYEYELGDMVLPGIAHCIKKDIVIFNTSPNAHCPVYVVEASKLCGTQVDNEIPICLAYDQSHYEAMVPDTFEDIMKTAERDNANVQNRKRNAAIRATQSTEEKEKKKAENTKRKAKSRANQSPEAKEKMKAENTKRMAQNRLAQWSSLGYKDALRSQEVMEGSYKVADLLDSPDNIGSMTHECEYCGALKFSRETASTCCSEGKVLLERFPSPPPDIDTLWHADTPAGRLFREHARSINNAVCLTSIKVKQRNFDGFNPSVIFEGKVQQLAGPLQAAPGEKPCFSQLYVLDPSLESSMRFENMTLPDNVSKAQKQVLKGVLETVQAALHACNPFIKDFKQIIDIPSDQIGSGKIVISSKSRPVGEHERRYNNQINLKEVRIVTNSEHHDLVLHQRGGGLHSIHDLNPKGMPLHFTLLFPHGTYGWDPNLKQTGGKRRVTTRQFYVFYINERVLEESSYI